MRELRLGLSGRTLRFPDGKAVCLACGAEPAGTRRVWFEEVRGGSLGTGDLARAENLGAGIAALVDRVSFDAPLCPAHRARARGYTLGAILCGLAAVGLIVLGAMWVGPNSGRKSKNFLKEWGPILLGLIPAIPGYVFWRKKDRGGLSCEVRREGEEIVLTFPD